MKRGIGSTSEVEEEKSVIDYILVNEKLKEEVERLETGNQESDYHHLIIIWLKDGREGGRNRKMRRSEKH